MTLRKLNYCEKKEALFSISFQRFFYHCLLFVLTLTFVPTAEAESPNVVSDIKPVHSLVNMVLGDLGTSELIISRNVSPHDYSMRPSEVRMVVDSDIIFWTGPVILPSFEKLFEELPPGTQEISLLEEVEDQLLPIRDLGSFFEDEDDHGDENEEEGHDDDDDHGEEKKSSGHDHSHEGDFDPHAWLDPYIALAWIDIITDVMISEDPDNKEVYLSNAKIAKAKINELDQEIKARLHNIEPRFIVFHDAFQYFENRYGLTAIGIITDQSGAAPGARHIRQLVDKISEVEVSCAFSEPLFEDDLLNTVVSGAEIIVYEIDPTGAGFEPEPDLYLNLISNVADSFIECASAG